MSGQQTKEIKLLEKCIFDGVALSDWQKCPSVFGTNCNECSTIYEVNNTSGKVYLKRNNQGPYTCMDCDSVIQQTTLYIPIHEFPEQLSGFGNCESIQQPYCPKCEEKSGSFSLPKRWDETSDAEEQKKLSRGF